MKKRNLFLLSNLQTALFKEENPSFTGADGTVSAGDGTSQADFLMTSGSDSCPGCPVFYNERVAGGPGSSTTRPIHEEDEPERAILLMDLPTDLGSWTMRVKLENPDLKDEVSISKAHGEYDALYAQMTKKFTLVHEEAHLFTVTKTGGKDTYETYINMNQSDEVIKLTYNSMNTFDVFRMSFLVLA